MCKASSIAAAIFIMPSWSRSGKELKTEKGTNHNVELAVLLIQYQDSTMTSCKGSILINVALVMTMIGLSPHHWYHTLHWFGFTLGTQTNNFSIILKKIVMIPWLTWIQNLHKAWYALLMKSRMFKDGRLIHIHHICSRTS